MKLTRNCSFVTRTFLSIRGWSLGFGSQFFLKDSRSWLNTACWCWPSDLLCTFDVVLKWKIHEDLPEQAFVDRKQGSFYTEPGISLLPPGLSVGTRPSSGSTSYVGHDCCESSLRGLCRGWTWSISLKWPKHHSNHSSHWWSDDGACSVFPKKTQTLVFQLLDRLESPKCVCWCPLFSTFPNGDPGWLMADGLAFVGADVSLWSPPQRHHHQLRLEGGGVMVRGAGHSTRAAESWFLWEDLGIYLHE